MSLRTILFPLLFVLIMVEPSAAQTIDRTKPPQPDPPPKTAFPNFQIFTLSNGLKVFYVHDDRPLVTFRLQVRGGNSRDGDITGLSDAAADVLTRGTTTRSAQQFASEIDYVGGAISASSTPDAVNVVASGLKKHLTTILGLFADAVVNANYPEDELAKYRQDQTSQLRVAKSQTSFLAQAGTNRVRYGNTTYGRTMNADDISQFTHDAVSDYHDTYFVPNNATLAFVGDLSKEELTDQLEAAFGDWKPGTIPAMDPPTFPALKGRRVVLIDRPASVQSSIRVISNGPTYSDDDWPKATILNDILGAGTGLGNRLAANLREKHGFTYTPYSQFDANLYGGMWVAAADVRNAVTDSAIAETLKEVARIETEPVGKDELQRNISSAAGGFMMSIANPSVTAQRLQFLDFYNRPKDYYNTLIDIYEHTTPQDVMSLARKYLDTANLAVVVVGRVSEIKPKIEAMFGADNVEVWDSDLNPVHYGNAAGGTGEATPNVTAQQAWSKMIDAMGGTDNIARVKSLRTTGDVVIHGGGQSFPGSYERVQARPNRNYEHLEVKPMLHEEQFFDGTNGSTINGGDTNGIPSDKLAQVAEQNLMFAETKVDSLGGSLKMRGTSAVNGVNAITVELDVPASGSTTYYLDPNTFLPVAQASAEGMMTTFNGWTDVDGVKYPSGFTLEPQPGVQIEFKNLTYQSNVPVTDAMFTVK